MVSRVTIKGLAGLQADLDNLSDDIVKGALKGREAVAEALAADIEADAPVDTGRLRRSVQVDGTQVLIGGTEAPYAEEVEDRDPFIQPNIDSIEQRAADIAEKALRKEIG